MGLDVSKIREDFPVLQRKVNGKPIIYFDNACMTLRPLQVIEKLSEYYMEYAACGDRSIHKLGKQVDEEVLKTREAIKDLINTEKTEEIVFTKNTTEGINIVAYGFDFKKGDIVLTTDKEHNSNLLPWQRLKQKGVVHKILKTNEDNTFSIENLEKAMNKNVRMVALNFSSNLDGVTNPIREISKIVHDYNALLMVDGAQGVPHHRVDVRRMGIDFLAFSGHKMMGPTGTGVLYGRYELLEMLKPFVTGGGTVKTTTYNSAEYLKPPHKFEAGLQHYSGIIGLGEAVRYLMDTGYENIEKHEVELNKILTEELGEDVEIIGPKEAEKRSGIFSFRMKGLNPHEIAILLDEMENIEVRSGEFCVHSWFKGRKVDDAVRVSFYLYNTKEEVEKFIETIRRIKQIYKE